MDLLDKIDKMLIDESSVVGGSYIAGTTNIVGTGQTRVIGGRDGEIEVLKRQPRPLKFSKLTGAYIPPVEDEEEPENS